MSSEYLSSSNLWPAQFKLPPPECRDMSNHAVIFCLTLDPICCSMQSFNKAKATKDMYRSSATNPSKVLISNMVVIVPAAAGYSKAPYEEKALPNSKYLSNIVEDEDLGRQMFVYGFDQHSSNKNEYRGDFREDVCALIRTGCTLKMMVGANTFNPKYASIFDKSVTDSMSVIPAFSIIRLNVKSGNAKGVGAGLADSSSNVNGCFAKFTNVMLLPNTLGTFLNNMKTFPSSFQKQKALTETCREYTKWYDESNLKMTPVATMLYGNGGECCFINDINTNMVCKIFNKDDVGISNENLEELDMKVPFAKLCNVSSETFDGEMIDDMDISIDLLTRYTNCPKPEIARQILQIAANLKALSVIVMKMHRGNYIPSTKTHAENISVYRGIPMVNFQKFIGIFWDNDHMRGLNDFLDILRKNNFKEDAEMKYGEGSDDEVKFTFENNKIVVWHVHRLYDDGDNKRMIYVTIDPRVRTDDVESVAWDKISADNQVIHKSIALPKLCRISIHLGRPIPNGDDIPEEDDVEKQNYINMKLNLSVLSIASFFGKENEASKKLNLKRKRISEEDGDSGFDSD